MTLRYGGVSLRRGGLKKGMYVTVPTKWATDNYGNVTADAIPEIMEALEEKWITIDDYDHVFHTYKYDQGGLINSPLRAGWRGCKVLVHWNEV